jgi:5'-3' exonuclease
MVTFRSNNNNNNRRPPFRSNNNRRPPFRSNNEGSKFSNNDNFRRSVPGRNNHNAVKLIEKYNDLAREALANEDKILSENYFQHADHFTRVQNEQESIRMARVNSSPAAIVKPVEESPAAAIKPAEVKDEKSVKIEVNAVKKIIPESVAKKTTKTSEKKSAAS